jgi:His-Xaa-Ser system radical SAM maturase HxsB
MDLNKMDTQSIGFLRFKRLNGSYLLTNDVGEYCFLEPSLFNALFAGEAGKIERNHPIKYNELSRKGFLRNSLNFDESVRKFCYKNLFLSHAPVLHIIIATLRCDHKCIYCQSKSVSPDLKGLDMDIETARKTVDRIFESPNREIIIEFQGGEPLMNFKTVRFVIEYARKKNKRGQKKLTVNLVSNLSCMNEEILDFLINKDVSICTSLDGPSYVHNKNRIFLDKKKKSYSAVIKSAKMVTRKFREKKFPHNLNALLTVSKFSLPYPKEIINEYLKTGFSVINLRRANTFIFSGKTPVSLKYTWVDFIEFYKKAFDYILELNLKGKLFCEYTALIFLTKILSDRDANFLDIRSPCGAGIGQLAYNYNGDVYTCDEGRMLSRIGDESFRIGNVKANDYSQIIAHPTVKAMCIASCLDNLAGCSDCAYKPYCGVCPLIHYKERGNIFVQQPNNEKCRTHKAILDYLFEKMKNERYKKIFEKWLDFAGVQKK